MIARRGLTVLLIGVGVAAGLGIAFRNPIRRWFKATYHPHERSTGRLQNNEGLAIDSEGTLYVANQDTGHLVVIDRSGKTLADFDTVEGYVDGDGRPDHITRGN